jgi:hypothetical protein
MECPRCENDVDGTVTFCPECGLNFEELRQELGLTDDTAGGSGATTESSSAEGTRAGASGAAGSSGAASSSGTAGGSGAGASNPAESSGAAGGQDVTARSRSDVRREPPAQESSGLLTRRRLLVGGVGAAGLGLWQTGNLEWLLGGGSGDWPVPSGVERVSLTEEQKNVVREQIGSQDAEVRVYSTTDGDPIEYYRTDTLDGWERQSSFQAGGTFKKEERGLLVLVQERGALLDLGLPRTSPRPTDVILMKADWQTIN